VANGGLPRSARRTSGEHSHDQTEAEDSLHDQDQQPDIDSGTIAQRLAIELSPIRPAKTTVKVFDIPQTACGGIGSILVNDVIHCRDASGDVADCINRISTSSKLPVTLSK